MPEFLPFSPPLVGEEELAELAQTLQSGWLTAGPKTERFEKEMARHLGTEETLALSSCTASLHLALAVLNLAPGQGVITTPLTFASTVHAIVYCGGRPFLTDIDGQGNLDPALVRKFLAEQCRPGPDGRPVHRESGTVITAVLPVHYGGFPADLPEFWSLAREWNLAVIEDAAHASGSLVFDRPIGHPAHRPPESPPGLACFSFYATKNMAAGEGGLLTASDPALLARARILAAYGISDARRIWGRYAPEGTWVYDVAELGWKYNFTDLQASLALVQLKKLPEFIKARKLRARIWTETLAELGDLVLLPREKPGFTSSWHLYPLRLNPDRLRTGRDQIIRHLKDLNIGTSVMFIPIHFHSYYQKSLNLAPGSLPRAEAFFRQEISLPLSPALPEEQIVLAARAARDLLDSLKA
ncbi:MAG: DegT/DnrJ/EryC1/StrS family aminotransferase [Deltaproteobacteria bacterium]|nr:DegT/DnrJ/EryC1/StrS family aminotransferase [Deltaproteobacteria bacterium]